MKRFLNAALLASAIVFLSAACTKQNSGEIWPQTFENQRLQIQVSQLVEEVGNTDQQYNFYADENKTALDLLKSGYKVETKTFSGIGEYVVSIDGKKESTGKNFWALYINGQQSQVGASSYKAKNGDKIEWKLETIKN